MKLWLTILLCILPVAPLLACEGFEQDMTALERAVAPRNASAGPRTASFGKEFASLDELRRWTETSTLGGGRLDEAEFEGRDFAFAYRSYTSGVKSSDAAIYVREGRNWKLVKAYPVLMGDWIVAEKQADSYLFHPEAGGKSLMVLSEADLKAF
ncbi:MAG: hypothetical protein DYH13_10015 [Alphaproteobacteria bacterium PRO2]|nr:hypothetical protein [Alphaproteobacteria bacterium PRO2]